MYCLNAPQGETMLKFLKQLGFQVNGLLIGLLCLAGQGDGSQRITSYDEPSSISSSGSMAIEERAELVRVDLESKKSTGKATRLREIGKLPLSFEENQGQVDEKVKYLARGKGYTLFLTETEAVLSLRNAASEKLEVRSEKETPSVSPLRSGKRARVRGEATKDHNAGKGESGTSVIRMKFAGANSAPKVNGDDQLPGIVNYFIGNDPDQWRTQIPTYKKVQYDNLYEGIDLVYYGNQGQLEYDLVVAPGSDPSQIQLAFEGTDVVTVDPDTGDLVISLLYSDQSPPPSGERVRVRGDASDLENATALRLLKPHVYQLVDGKKVEITANYVVQADSSQVSLLPSPLSTSSAVNIQLASYDITKPLIIDPVLHWSTYLGTTGNDGGRGIAVDSAGAVYITGEAGATGFPEAVGNPIQPSGFAGGVGDAFVLKLNSAGTALIYATYMGTTGADSGNAIVVDAAGAVYVTGEAGAAGFPGALGNQIQPGGFAGGSRDVFVAKLNPAGTGIVYSTYLGTSGRDRGVSIAVDGLGAAYITGPTDAAGFPMALGNLIQPGGFAGGPNDAFVAKLNPAGTGLAYATYLGTSGWDEGNTIVVDAAGAAYVVGEAGAAGFPGALGNPIQPGGFAGSGSFGDAFVVKVNPAGNGLVYSTYLGTSGGDAGWGLAVDGAGAAYITGPTEAAGFPGALGNLIQPGGHAGGTDVFVAKVNPAGTALVYATYLGTNGEDFGHHLVVDAAGAAYVTGQTGAAGLPGTSGSVIQPDGHAGGQDAFLAKLNQTGTGIDYATYLGTSGRDVGVNLEVDAAGTVLVTGLTEAAGFPGASESVIQPDGFAGGVDDAFVAKVCNSPPPGTAPGTWIQPSGIGSMVVARAAHTSTRLANGNILIVGGNATTPSFVTHVTAEVFDSTARIFSATGSMDDERALHTATLLPDGKVLVAGGSGATGTLSTAELYTTTSPTSGVFTNTSVSTGGMQVSRASHAALLLPDGNVLLVGGFTSGIGTIGSAELFDSATGLFASSPPGPMNIPRQAPTMTLLPNGTVLIVGGFSGGASTNLAEIYDPTTQLFTLTVGTLNTPRGSHRATLLANGKVLITGGRNRIATNNDFALASAELYDPVTQEFSVTSSMIHERASHAAVLLHEGRVLIASGFENPDGILANSPSLKSAELYDPGIGGGVFTLMAPLNFPRSNSSEFFSVLPNGQVLVIGGSSSTSVADLSTAELYTPNLCGPESDLVLTVTDSPDPVTVGTSLQVDVQVLNGGPDDDAAEVKADTDFSSTDLTFATGGQDPDCTEGTGPMSGHVTCQFGLITKGAEPLRTIIFDTTTAMPGIKAITSTVENVDEFDPDFGNNTQINTFIMQSANPTTDLILTITDTPDPVPLSPGMYSYTLTVDNMGTDVAIATVVTADIPTGVTLDSATFPGGTCSGTGAGPATATCNVGDVDVLSATQIILNMTPTTAGTKTLTATAGSTGPNAVPDLDDSNNTNITETTSVGLKTFTVNSVLDGGDAVPGDGLCETATPSECTLRAAIQEANHLNNSGLDVIGFDVNAGGQQTISPASALPIISDPVVIDGTTQPGFINAPIIELNGSLAGATSFGLFMNGGDSTLRGLVINRFGRTGIVTQSAGNRIVGNYIGTNLDGTAALGNNEEGLTVEGPDNIVGGTRPEDRNVISGNARMGILIQQPTATGNQIIGNFIGTTASGHLALGNGVNGVHIVAAATGNTVGGLLPGSGNVISGNSGGNGVMLGGSGGTLASNNFVQGNYIGTNAAGTAALLNGGGITITGPDNIVGGTTASARNVISGNGTRGILITSGVSGPSAFNNTIQGNYIGTDVTGNVALANGFEGIWIINGAANNTIGGEVAGAGNVISGNNATGLHLGSNTGGASENNVVQGNIIGLTASGDTGLGNSGHGILIITKGNTIGGITAFERNVVSGNTLNGVAIANAGATNNVVEGNYIGMNSAGLLTIPNVVGVSIISSGGNTIGGVNTVPGVGCAGACNLISGNSDDGVSISGSGSDANTVAGNVIGLDINGNVLGNTDDGVFISAPASRNIIGGTTADMRNVISGNGDGVSIFGTATLLGNMVQGNYIGTDPTGLLDRGNLIRGVRIEGASGNCIGGTAPVALGDPCVAPIAGNVIAGTDGDGVILETTATGNYLQGNLIGTNALGTVALGNALTGVSLNGTGVALNSPSNNTVGGTTVAERNVISGNLGNGVVINQTSSSNMVQGNYIGSDVTGTADLGNTQHGVFLSDAPTNTIGGITAGARNIISGNDSIGVRISGPTATGNLVQGNYIGTDLTGTVDLGNTLDGVSLAFAANGNTIGGAVAGARNLISGNGTGVPGGDGVELTSPGTTGNLVQGNYIGTDVTGLLPMANFNGVHVTGGASGNTVGGTLQGSDNVISGNVNTGVSSGGTASTPTNGNLIQGNLIGTDATGMNPLGNGGTGVLFVQFSSFNEIGGTVPGAGNTIAFNGAAGVVVTEQVISPGNAGSGNAINQNVIHTNGGLGIDLASDGITPNDPQDVDGSPNNLQNFPVLEAALSNTNSTTIQGTLNSTPNRTFRLEFFSNSALTGCDASGNGEGEAFLGFANVTTNGSGDVGIETTFSVQIPALDSITATATDLSTGDTSEFSNCVTVTANPIVVAQRIYGLISENSGSTAPGTPTHLFSFLEDGSDLTDHGAVQISNTDIFFADGLALSPVHGLLAFERAELQAEARLIQIDPTTAEATVIGSFQANLEGIRAAVFDEMGQLWVVDINADELLRIDPLTGDEVLSSRVAMSLDTNSFDVNRFSDLAVRADGIMFLVNRNQFFHLNLQTGELSLQFTDNVPDPDTSTAPFHNGAAFSTNAGMFDLFTFDGQTLDDVFQYDLALNFSRTELIQDVVPTVNAGHGDLATLTPMATDLFQVTIDATALSAPQFAIRSIGRFDGTVSQDLQLAPGAYEFCNVRCGGTVFTFTVENDGTVDFDVSLEAYISGRGTDTLVVNGFTVNIDATALTAATFGLQTVIGAALIVPSMEATVVQPVTLVPASYSFCDVRCGAATFAFSVEDDGTVDFDVALDGFLSGRGTTTLVVDGFTVSIDATALSAPTFGLAGNGSGGRQIENLVPTTTVQTFTLVASTNYVFCDVACGSRSFLFTVADDGTVDFDPTLDGFLSGRGTSTLVVDGFTVNIDATALSAPSFGISGNGSGSRRIADPVDSTMILTLTLVAASNYVFCDVTCGTNTFNFSVENDGTVGFDSALDGFLSGRGTSTLMVDGFTVSIDATALTAPTFGLAGNSAASRRIASPVDSTGVQTFTLVASTNYVFCEVSCGAETFEFTVENDGTVDFAPSLGAFVNGRSTTTLVVSDSVAVGLTLTVNVNTDAVGLSGDANPGDGVCETATPGECTLRAAIQETNHANNSGLDLIVFDIGAGGQQTIAPTSPLPNINDAVVIDGTTQPLFAGSPIIELDGTGAGVVGGLNVQAGNSTVRSLVINRFNIGIHLGTNGGNLIVGNYIGTDVTGTQARANGSDGIRMTFSANNQIGGTTAGDRNIISGNTNAGVSIGTPTSSNNRVQGNYIGTDAMGTSALPNTVTGVAIIEAPNNTIGGTASGEGNVISGNNAGGVAIVFPDSTGNIVQGNLIGPDVTGTVALGNGSINSGVTIKSASGNTIGGLSAAARNIISANGGSGISVVVNVVAEGPAEANVIQGNYIGTDITGTVDMGNGVHGVSLSNADNNLIGGTSPGARNIISGNDTQGIGISGTSTGNFVQGNYIGTDVSGAVDLGNTLHGILSSATAGNNTIGGTVAEAGNVISGNDGDGIQFVNAAPGGNQVQGNYIGTNAAGTLALGNSGNGIGLLSNASNHTIGGTTAGARNIISGNGSTGVLIFAAGATGNLVQGNYIGTDVTGTVDLGNTAEGVFISGAPTNTIGGVIAGARNIISGNARDGVEIRGAAATGNLVQGNYIGTDVTGTVDLGNTTRGVRIIDASANTIGGTIPGARNVISGNNLNGVSISGAGATGNIVQGNYIGTDVNGTAALGNSQMGVHISGAPTNTIGGMIASAGNLISGNSFSGVDIEGSGSTGNMVEGNFIGTDNTGAVPLGNTLHGVRISGGVSNTIGGTTALARNVISGNNANGVLIFGASTGNFVRGNYIGTNVNGTEDLGNSQDGVYIDDADTNTIGGDDAADGLVDGLVGARNVISGNLSHGVLISDPGATGNFVQGNFIGTNAAGTAALGNGDRGVRIVFSASGNTIGGTAAGARNVISGNAGAGVELIGSATLTLVQGNYIGTDVTGAAPLGNGNVGVLINEAPSNTIGGTTAGAGNVIAFNTLDGVTVNGTAATGNAILANAIFSNVELGIDFNLDGVTANDPDGTDDDTGPNNLQNYPELLGVSDVGGATVVVGTLTSTPDTAFTVELYKNGTCDASGFGEGETLVHTEAVTTDPTTGTVTFEFTVAPAVATGFGLTATATDPQGNTSEFSNCLLYTVPLSVLEVRLLGNGIGTVTSTPVGLALDSQPGAACTGNQGAECRLVVPQNTVIEHLVAEAASGTNFIGWSGDKCRGPEPCVFSVTAPRTIVGASFCPTVGACDLPETPVGFSCESYWPNTITCSWQPVAEAIGYRVLRGEATREYDVREDIGLVTAHTFTGLEPDVTYYKAVSSLTLPTSGSPLVAAAVGEPEASAPSGEHIHTNVVEFAGDRWVTSAPAENEVDGPAMWEPSTTGPVILKETSGVHDPIEAEGRGALIERPTGSCRLDYKWSTNIQATSMAVGGGQGLIVRYRDENNYYRVAVDWTQGPTQPRLRFLKRTGGVFTEMAPDVDLSDEEAFHLGPAGMPQPKPLEVIVEGNQFTVFLDGLAQYSTVPDAAVHDGLGVGFAVWQNGANAFSPPNEVPIEYLGDPPPDCAALELVAEGTGTGTVQSVVQPAFPEEEAAALPGTPQAAYPLGTTVQLTATAAEPTAGSVEWRGCGPATETPVMASTLAVVMDQTQICQVRFPGTPTQVVTWDVDGNGVADTRDAGMLTRWAFGLRDAAMVEGLIDTNGARASAGAIATYLEAARLTMVDVDGDGVAGTLTDTQIVMRFFHALAAGQTETELRANSALITGVVNPNGTRVTLTAIVDHLLRHLPSGSGVVSALTDPGSEGLPTPTVESLEAPLTPFADVESEEMSKPRQHKEKKNTRQKRRSKRFRKK